MAIPKSLYLFLFCFLSAFIQQAYMQSACCECVIDVGFDYNGGDLSGPAIGVKSVEDCQQICNLQSQCLYFAYGTGGDVAGYCWQKGVGARIMANADRTSGRRCA